jgi:hypothetical protein
MSVPDVPPTGPPAPPTTPKAEAHARLKAAEFSRLHINAVRTPHCELWQNRHGKTVNIDYVDSSFEHCWTESLETAPNARDSIPADPFAGFWETIFSRRPK